MSIARNSTMPSRRAKVLVVVAVPMTVKAFLLPYLEQLAKVCHVTVACAEEDGALRGLLPAGVDFKPVAIQRAISPLADARALMALIALMRAEKFSLVHSVTPKAGLLSMLAAFVSAIPLRLHMFTGQVWATKSGVARWVLKKLDTLIAGCATHVLADSRSQMDFLLSEKVVRSEKINVLGNGSISGVDLLRFCPDPEARQRVRSRLGYADDDVLALFVGRLNRDKGVLDLVQAFLLASAEQGNLALLVVGPDEEGLRPMIELMVKGNSRIHLLGGTSTPEEYMAAADVFCLPSYREGFGSVIIEAAACGVPAMASAIYGLTDAVEDGKSGCLHPVGDVATMARLLQRFAREPVSRLSMGAYARQRAIADFASGTVVAAEVEFIAGLLDDTLGDRNGAQG
jgi:glycosyltransferase involved in cell wall biosynthesis